MDPSFLVGTVKAEDDEDRHSIASMVRDLEKYCEAHGWKGNVWSFRSNFTQKEYIQLEEGDLFDLMRSIFPTLLELRHFHEATYWMEIHCGDEKRESYQLNPSMIAMCAALGIGIDIVTPASWYGNASGAATGG